MKAVQKSGRTVDEAVAHALAELGARADQVSVEVLEEPKKGVLGLIGGKNAVVRVTLKEVPAAPASPTPVAPAVPAAPAPGRSATATADSGESKQVRVERLLRDICRAMAVDCEVSVHQDGDTLHADVNGAEAGILIGHHGQTLDALQFLVNLISGKSHDDGVRVIVDVEGYRRRRDETLTKLATRLAERVQRTGEETALEPMTAQERRVIHMALAENPHVTTASEGDEPNRRVVIAPRR